MSDLLGLIGDDLLALLLAPLLGRQLARLRECTTHITTAVSQGNLILEKEMIAPDDIHMLGLICVPGCACRGSSAVRRSAAAPCVSRHSGPQSPEYATPRTEAICQCRIGIVCLWIHGVV